MLERVQKLLNTYIIVHERVLVKTEKEVMTVKQHSFAVPVPARTAYRRNRTTYRTVLRPLGLRDPQQAQPEAWCQRCGAEVYRPDTLLCRRCGKYD